MKKDEHIGQPNTCKRISLSLMRLIITALKAWNKPQIFSKWIIITGRNKTSYDVHQLGGIPVLVSSPDSGYP